MTIVDSIRVGFGDNMDKSFPKGSLQGSTGLRWDNVSTATNFKQVFSMMSEKIAPPTGFDRYPDTGESGDTYDVEMTDVAHVEHRSAFRRLPCPTCGQSRADVQPLRR